MSPERSGEFDVRRLCRAAHTISMSTGQPAKPHPLGLGIKRRHDYKPVGRRIARFPADLAGLEQIRTVASKPIPGLAEEFFPAAWGALIGRPTLLAELLPPTPESLLQAGFPVPPSADASRLRQLAIATVVHPDTLTLNKENELTDFRMAGVGRVILLTSPHRPETSEEAWLEAEWTDSSVRLSGQLEQLLDLAPDETRRAGHRRPALLFTTLDLAERIGERLKSAALVCGFHISIYTERQKSFYGQALKEIKASAPLVLVQRAVRSDVAAIIHDCEKTPDCRVFTLDDGADEVILDEVRRRALADIGVGASLFVRAGSVLDEDTGESAIEVLPPFPLTVTTAAAIHQTFHRFERGNEVDDWRWFSRDRAGHAGVAFKKFTADRRGLTWVADLTADGEIFEEKHKGSVGLFISWTELSILFVAAGTPGVHG